jgi:sugar/nucleoside kinase (ribokinase family)
LPARDDKGPFVLCAGIAVLDEVFRVVKMPARDTKVEASEYVTVSGGCAANAAVAIARLGGRAGFAGPLGDDETAQRVLAGLAREQVDCAGCVRKHGMRTSVSAIIVDEGGARTIATYTDRQLMAVAPADAATLVAQADMVLVDNRRPHFVAPICAAARMRGIPIVLDADKATNVSDELLQAATHVIFSAESLRATMATDDLGAALSHVDRSLKKFVAVTNGPGDILWCDGGSVNAMPVFKVHAVDTLAAGDVFHGAFALALAEGQGVTDALRFAAAAAAVKCQRFGGSATAPSRVEVEALLAKQR